MDIDYLLLLQNLRNYTHDFFSPFLLWVSDFAVGFWPIAIAAMIYWVFDRSAGKRIFAGFGLGVLMNGFLKLTFRITRPWLRDSRVLPFGNSKVTATGYSFPSGHSTFATALLGGTGLWFRKRNRILCAVFLVFAALVLFSRNYLGVHTPQDVFAGFACTALMMFIAVKVENWTDEDPERDLYVMIAGIAVCIAFVIYYHCIHIQSVYDDTGRLVVDPAKMVADSYEGIGFVSSFVICRYFERRYFFFDTEMSWKDRFIIGTFALIPLYLWCYNIFGIVAPYSRSLARFTLHSGIVIYIMIIVPFGMSKIHHIKD